MYFNKEEITIPIKESLWELYVNIFQIKLERIMLYIVLF